jgi:hypothetical protein
MMRNLLKVLTIAGLAALTGGAASAQDVGVRIGIGDPGYRERRVVREVRPVVERRYVERRRIVREPVRTRTVCRTEFRERVRPSGVVVRRPVEICRRTVAGRRVYVD